MDEMGYLGEVPRHVVDRIDHYRSCWAEADRCIHCGDCIAFFLLCSEKECMHPYALLKFLTSTISAEYLPCRYNRALTSGEVDELGKALLELPVEKRREIRSLPFLAHAEFQSIFDDIWGKIVW